jgi:hypothetical protein
MGLSRMSTSSMRLTPSNWTGSRVTVLLPSKGVPVATNFAHSVTCTVPALASAQARWQARMDALAQGQVIVGSRLGFAFNSTQFMNTPGGTLTLLVEIADPGQNNWRRYVESTHTSGLSTTTPAEPTVWPMPSGIPDLWDGDAYDVRITATCSLNVDASLHYDVI